LDQGKPKLTANWKKVNFLASISEENNSIIGPSTSARLVEQTNKQVHKGAKSKTGAIYPKYLEAVEPIQKPEYIHGTHQAHE